MKQTMAFFKSYQKGQTLILAIILVIIVGSAMLVGGFSLPKNKLGQGEPASGVPDLKENQVEKSNLQMETFSFKAPPVCAADAGACYSEKVCACPSNEMIVYCSLGHCVSSSYPAAGIESYGCGFTTDFMDGLCNYGCGTKDGYLCWMKPVIYLYPETPMHVDVKVETNGKIVVSNPLYPPGGWQNVLAYPDGKLIYQDKEYRELFYETESGEIAKPAKGIIIASLEVEEKLKTILYRIGLNEWESQEFMDFWIPKLKNLNSNYILFSIVDKTIKGKVDKVVIDPKPDTKIEFLVYFKPLDFPIAIKPLALPKRPERIGFTSVEWGGTIDR